MLRTAFLLPLLGLSVSAVHAEECPGPAPTGCCAPDAAGTGAATPARKPKIPRDTDAPIEITSESASLTRAGDATLEGRGAGIGGHAGSSRLRFDAARGVVPGRGAEPMP